MTGSNRVYDALVRRDLDAEADLPDQVRRDVPIRQSGSMLPQAFLTPARAAGAGALSGLADRSGRTLMAVGAAVASLVIALVLVLSRVPALRTVSNSAMARSCSSPVASAPCSR